MTSAAARPRTWPSRPWAPSRSTNPECHRSTSTHFPVTACCSQRGLPRRVSSMPSTRVGAGAAELAIGDLDERGMRGRPRHPERAGHLADRPVRVPDRDRDRLPQPPRRPRTRRHLTDRLGEALPLAQRLPAPPPALVPHHRDRPCPVRDIARRRRHVALHRRRQHPTRRTAAAALASGLDMDFPDAARQQHDTLHAHACQPEQQRRIVAQARGLFSGLSSTTASVQRPRAPTPQAETACRARSRSKSRQTRDASTRRARRVRHTGRSRRSQDTSAREHTP